MLQWQREERGSYYSLAFFLCFKDSLLQRLPFLKKQNKTKQTQNKTNQTHQRYIRLLFSFSFLFVEQLCLFQGPHL